MATPRCAECASRVNFAAGLSSLTVTASWEFSIRSAYLSHYPLFFHVSLPSRIVRLERIITGTLCSANHRRAITSETDLTLFMPYAVRTRRAPPSVGGHPERRAWPGARPVLRIRRRSSTSPEPCSGFVRLTSTITLGQPLALHVAVASRLAVSPAVLKKSEADIRTVCRTSQRRHRPAAPRRPFSSVSSTGAHFAG
jgi:hypothetical protein